MKNSITLLLILAFVASNVGYLYAQGGAESFLNSSPVSVTEMTVPISTSNTGTKASLDRTVHIVGELNVKMQDELPIFWNDTTWKFTAAEFPFLAETPARFEIFEFENSFWWLHNPKLRRIVRVRFRNAELTDELIKILNAHAAVEYAERVPI